jgi:RNA polymerase sigma-70 factor (ECF subfamily)
VRLYDLLLSVAPSPAAALSRAVAVAEAAGPESGLAALDDIPPGTRWHAVRAELLARAGRYAEAVAELDAAGTGGTGPERRYRARQRADWELRSR